MSITIKQKKNEYEKWIFVAYGEDEDFKCWKCRKEITEGYTCENNEKIILCKKCNDEWDFKRCKHDKMGEHRHIKWTRGKDETSEGDREALAPA